MEYYVKSLSMENYEQLPKQVVLYFQFDNQQLTEIERAYLFANIVKNRDLYETTYEEYLPVIQEFVKKQISAFGNGKNSIQNIAFVVVIYKMGNHFRICIGFELIAFFDKLLS